MDGRYSVFGYVVKGQDVLGKLTADDKIVSAKVVDGLENLKS
jgi:peptidylprolyl isomerase